MPSTLNRGYPYPARTDMPKLGWLAIQALAEALDTDVATLAAAVSAIEGKTPIIEALEESIANIEGEWTDFTPTVWNNMGTTPAAISSGSIQVNYAKYRKVGRTVDAMASVVVNTTTTNGVGIDLPFPSSTRLFNCGTCLLMGPGTLPPDQSGVAYMFTDNARLVLVAVTNGFRNVQTSGQQLRYSVRYEAAS